MGNKSTHQEQEAASFDELRNMFLPIKDNDWWIVKLIKNSIFYMAALMMFISTLLLFAAVLIAA
ncbi:hypothetical protein [Flavobacterium sp. '19STA2R22 D10 B1']|uniref:hypothetical protein n=1 Tax=Flavobacterium aerium TaxID=3037261 RepID=UPI00278BD73D|nr:hypothetical protein [Flavobacterium sp. '19STA2R22 D10 B1']